MAAAKRQHPRGHYERAVAETATVRLDNEVCIPGRRLVDPGMIAWPAATAADDGRRLALKIEEHLRRRPGARRKKAGLASIT